jgi:hypothetical protein
MDNDNFLIQGMSIQKVSGLGFQFELSYFEPFMVFLYKVAGTVLFVFAAVIAILSLFFNKPYGYK